jgi:hypothetical protein
LRGFSQPRSYSILKVHPLYLRSSPLSLHQVRVFTFVGHLNALLPL